MVVKKDMAVQRLQMRSGNGYQHPDGAFIVRPSENNADDLSLSVRCAVCWPAMVKSLCHCANLKTVFSFCFAGHFSRWTWVSRYQNISSNQQCRITAGKSLKTMFKKCKFNAQKQVITSEVTLSLCKFEDVFPLSVSPAIFPGGPELAGTRISRITSSVKAPNGKI